ncbi:hypothetical protein ACOSP7_005104 [Xanthoceras sorbifolium]
MSRCLRQISFFASLLELRPYPTPKERSNALKIDQLKAEAKAGEVKCNSQTHIEKLQQQVVELISSDVVRLRAQEEKINAPLEKVKKIAEDAVVKTKAELIKEIKEDRIDH